MQASDSLYHRLFSDPVMIEQLVALLFRIEICDRPDDLPGLVAQAVAWFKDHPGHATLRLAFGDLVAHAVAGLVGAPPAATVPMDIEEVQGCWRNPSRNGNRNWPPMSAGPRPRAGPAIRPRAPSSAARA
ncbi:hypothetical protein JL100_033855 (plasmid) [Skermanella mucosa]|uniref:hypothetical protein n=1 Tax=Skermanella mucosa TaxID=1789672 RepID=UPI00192B151C|nr:hypothetical protein [Skermanella mucosa]UEM25072.1 hypothetical protein JL100_033855 [Skermanella mucosa]